MLSESPAYLYSVLDREYFEKIERYLPLDEYSSVVREAAPDPWEIKPAGFWTLVRHPDCETLIQGWKIHISAVEDTAVETLQRIVPILVRDKIEFKFVSDSRMLQLSINKNWARTGAGKFITIYPTTEEIFVALIEELYQATEGLQGPHILSDRPYKDSKVVFYRYGEHYSLIRVDPFGFRRSGIRTPDGEWSSDHRRPYFHLPEWVKDPLSDAVLPEPPGEDGVLLKNRYRVKTARKFNAVGGIYVAEDTETGNDVLIREARPMMGSKGVGSETFELLDKEARILQKLGPANCMPQFVDIFQEWEHRFLVQEMLQAESLWGYAISFALGSAKASPGETYDRLRMTIRKLAEGLQVVHDAGVILRDLTRSNVMVTLEDEIVKFIDLEFAFELDRDAAPVIGWTPGYASPEQMSNQLPTPADDCYALGAIILDIITFTANGYDLNPKGILLHLEMILGDLRWPLELVDVVAGLMHPKAEERWDLKRLLKALDEIPLPTLTEEIYPPGPAPLERPTPTAETVAEFEKTLEGITQFIQTTTTPQRDDRYWPASAELFMTNPVNLLYGSAGTAYYLWKVTGEMPVDALEWTVKVVESTALPPGLASGLGGVALVFLELGQVELAKNLLSSASSSEFIHEHPGLYFGSSGWGLTNLHFWAHTQEQQYLDAALECGEHLLKVARDDDPRGLYWVVDTGTFGEKHRHVQLGLGQGGAGVALFLTYLHAASGDSRFLEAAVKGMDFDLSEVQQNDELLLWFPRTNAAVDEPKSPHMRFGTAGMGTALLRLNAFVQDPRYEGLIEHCAYSVARRMTNKIWFDYGISGYGEYLMDCHDFTGEEIYRNNAFFISDTLLRHRIFKDNGIAYGGVDLIRISCDFAQGSAGIGLFINRLLNPGTSRFLMLDGLLGSQNNRLKGHFPNRDET